MEHVTSTAREAPTFWDEETPRPQCPKCQMRMMSIASAQGDRHYQCLRCAEAD